MATVEAGVVAGADIYSQPAASSGLAMKFNQPGTWSYVWVGAALLYLIGIYMGAVRISGRD